MLWTNKGRKRANPAVSMATRSPQLDDVMGRWRGEAVEGEAVRTGKMKQQ